MEVLLTPSIICGYGLALALLIFELRTSSTGWLLPAVSAAIAVSVTVLAFLAGATLGEIALVAMIFVLVALAAYKRRGDK